MNEIVNPEAWPRPRGYANAISASGRLATPTTCCHSTAIAATNRRIATITCELLGTNVTASLVAGDNPCNQRPGAGTSHPSR